MNLKKIKIRYMKNLFKSANFLFIIALMVCLYPKLIVHASQLGVEQEPNNTADMANPIQVNANYKGNVADNYDNDFYKVVLTSDGNVTINLNHKQVAGDGDNYWNVKLSDGGDNEYANFDVTGKDGQISKNIGLPKGTYYVQISMYAPYNYNLNNNMDYNLNIGFKSSNLYEKEFNNTAAKANPILINTKYIGRMDTGYDNDFYKVTLTSDGNVTINLNHKQVAGDGDNYWNIKLSDGGDNEYANFDVTGKDGQISKNIGLPKGTYYVQISLYAPYNYNPNNAMDYNINIGFKGSNLYEKEFNNSEDKANPIQINTNYTGRLDIRRDTDYYAGTLLSAGDVIVNFNHTKIVGDENLYWDVSILDSNGNPYTDFKIKGDDGQISKNIHLPKGTYYIQITNADPSYNYDDCDYQISVASLAVPASPKATSVGYNAINTSWNSVTGSSGYQLYRSTSSTGTYSLVSATASRGFTNIGLNTGTTYYYKVRAYTAVGTTRGYGNYSSVVSAKPIPSMPSSIKAASSSYNSINVGWSGVAGASKYEVYRATSSKGTYNLISTITGLNYNNTGLTTNSIYYYKVRAYRMVGKVKVYSGFSTTINSKPILANATSVKASSTSYNSINVSWSGVAGASRYEIYKATSSKGTYTLLSTTTGTSYKNAGVTTNSTYYYKVRAYRTVGKLKVYSGYSNIISSRPIPSAPLSVKATSSSYNSINVSWNAVSGASKYEIYRATSSKGTYTLLSATTGTSYKNNGLTTNSTYYYKIRAYRMVGTVKVYSSFSSLIGAKPVPVAPTNVKATRTSSKSIKLTWSKTAGDSGYEVYRATSSKGSYSLVSRITSLYYTNSRLVTGRTYYYKVRSYRNVGKTRVYSNYWSVIVHAKV